jgi:prevent-host-death family protein
MEQRVVSATEARTHLGELMREVAQGGSPIIVERDGKAQIVLISLAEYERLRAGRSPEKPWRELVREVRERVREDLGGRTLTPPEEIIRQMREERDEQLSGLR